MKSKKVSMSGLMLTLYLVISTAGAHPLAAQATTTNTMKVVVSIRERGIWTKVTSTYGLPVIRAKTNDWLDVYGVVHKNQIWDTFLPVSDIIKIISQCGYPSSWNPETKTWSFPNDGIVGAFDLSNMVSGSGTIHYTSQGLNLVSHIPLLYRHGVAYMQFDVYKYVMSMLSGIQSSYDNASNQWIIVGAPLVPAGKDGSSKHYLGLGAARNPSLPPVSQSTFQAALSLAKQSFTSMTPLRQYSPMATSRQWFPNPKDIFYDKHFPPSDLVSGKVLQKYPLVVVEPYSYGAGSTDVLEYIGWSQTSSQRHEGNVPGFSTDMSLGDYYTFWKGERVSLDSYGDITAGTVTSVSNLIGSIETPWGQFMQGDPSQGIHITTNANLTTLYWAVGSGMAVIPIPGWSPTKKLTPPWNAYVKWN